MASEEDCRACTLRWREMVGSHQLYRRARQNLLFAVAAAGVLPFVQHHAAEGKVIIDGGDKPSTARFACRRSTPCAIGRIIKVIELVLFAVKKIKRRQPV